MKEIYRYIEDTVCRHCGGSGQGATIHLPRKCSYCHGSGKKTVRSLQGKRSINDNNMVIVACHFCGETHVTRKIGLQEAPCNGEEYYVEFPTNLHLSTSYYTGKRLRNIA